MYYRIVYVSFRKIYDLCGIAGFVKNRITRRGICKLILVIPYNIIPLIFDREFIISFSELFEAGNLWAQTRRIVSLKGRLCLEACHKGG